MIVNWSSAYLFLVLTYSHNSRFSLVLKGQTTHADVAELADALDSGSSVLTDVEVRILSSALGKNRGFWSFGWKPLFRYQKKNTKPCQKSIFNRQFRRTHRDNQGRDKAAVLCQKEEYIHNLGTQRL
jgi:hypothetical protein